MKIPAPIPLLLISTLPPLCAQSVVDLDPLLVTAERAPGKLADMPYTVNYIDSAYIYQENRRTLPDALQHIPGVLVQKTAYGHGSPFIRGFTGRQNLLLMDGVRMNNSTFRSGPVQYWNTIDPLSLDHIELVKSQGSVLYGSDAIGGTLNAFGKAPDFRSATANSAYIHGMGSYEYRTNGQGSNIGRIEADTGMGGVFGVRLGASLKDYGDIRDRAYGEMKNTGYPEQDYDLRADYAVTADSTLTLASYYVNQDKIWRWHRTTDNRGWNDDGHIYAPGTYRSDIYDQEHSLSYLRYAGTNPQAGAIIDRWSATISFQRTDDSEFMDRLTGSRPVRKSNIRVNTYGADLELGSKIGPGDLVYGVDYYEDRVNSDGFQVNANGTSFRESLPVADNSNYRTFGLFSQYTWHATQAFDLTGGARYTHVDAGLGRYYDAANVLRFGNNQDWDHLVGNLRGIYHLGGGWSAYGGVAQSFRAPNLDDLSGNVTAKSGVNSIGNANVHPEKFITYELGSRYECKDASFGVAAFYTDARDMIAGTAISKGSATTTTINASDGYVYGFECEGAWRFLPQWELSGFAAWQDSRLKAPNYVGGPSESKPNARQLPFNCSAALRWTHPSNKFWVEARVLASTREDRVTIADQISDNQRIPTGGAPGYVVASLNAGYTFNEHLDFKLGFENITNENYRIPGSGQNEPGFGAILGARVTW